MPCYWVESRPRNGLPRWRPFLVLERVYTHMREEAARHTEPKPLAVATFPTQIREITFFFGFTCRFKFFHLRFFVFVFVFMAVCFQHPFVFVSGVTLRGWTFTQVAKCSLRSTQDVFKMQSRKEEAGQTQAGPGQTRPFGGLGRRTGQAWKGWAAAATRHECPTQASVPSGSGRNSPSSPHTDPAVGPAAGPSGTAGSTPLPRAAAATGPPCSAASSSRTGAPPGRALGDAATIHTPTCTASLRYRCPHWETRPQAGTTMSTPGPSHSGASGRHGEMLTACWRLQAGPARGALLRKPRKESRMGLTGAAVGRRPMRVSPPQDRPLPRTGRGWPRQAGCGRT